jgi:hypothetical protein
MFIYWAKNINTTEIWKTLLQDNNNVGVEMDIVKECNKKTLLPLKM